MAITKLDHIKENKKGRASSHLVAVLFYILNLEKTEDRLWCGGNCTTDPRTAYELMMDRKREFGKLYGRQGYHFVISFQPGECDEQTAYMAVREFCERYLGNEYQYVFAIHNDQAHLHGHIVFNSISQIDGYKYRYVDGDWEKYIQPITDEVCKKYGLSELVYDRENKKGVSYAQWLADKDGKITGKDIIRADIDHAIHESNSLDDFFYFMRQMGYGLRPGHSKNYGPYYAYSAPGLGRARRDYRLGAGYRLWEIEERIQHKKEEKAEPAFIREKLPVLRVKGSSRFQILYVRRVREAMEWHYFAFRLKEQSRVRKDLLKIDRLHEECTYLIEHDLKSLEDVKERCKEVRNLIRLQKEIDEGKEALAGAVSDSEEKRRYAYLQERIKDPTLSDEEAEEAMDEAEMLLQAFPALAEGPKKQERSRAMDALIKERRILNRILKEAPVTETVRDDTSGSGLQMNKTEERKDDIYEEQKRDHEIDYPVPGKPVPIR